MRHKIALHALFWGRRRFILIAAVDSGVEARGEVTERCEQLGEVTAGRFRRKERLQRWTGDTGGSAPLFLSAAALLVFTSWGKHSWKVSRFNKELHALKVFQQRNFQSLKYLSILCGCYTCYGHELWTTSIHQSKKHSYRVKVIHTADVIFSDWPSATQTLIRRLLSSLDLWTFFYPEFIRWSSSLQRPDF